MTPELLKNRFKAFALNIITFAEALPESAGFRAIRKQMIDSGTSSAANYRSACRRKSTRDFIAKMGIVEEELDETLFWLELSAAMDQSLRPTATPLWKEGNELLSISVATIKTSRKNFSEKKTPPINKP